MNSRAVYTATVTTGKVLLQQPSPQEASIPKENFAEVLNKTQSRAGISFSKHAAARVEQRNIDVSPEKLERLGKGMKLAESKGLNDTLILIDRTAFLVNIRNNKVITTLSGNEVAGNVFTNIDGTVVI